MTCFFHYTKATGVSGHRREYIARNMAQSAAGVILSSIPGRPEEGKWTKTPPSVDFFHKSKLPNNLIKHLVLEASKKIKIEVVQDPSLPIHKLTFGQAQGVRLGDTKLLVDDSASHAKLVVYTLMMNPTRCIHYMYFKSSRDLHSPLEPNLYLDFLNPEHSAVQAASQYISTLVAGLSPHLLLLWDGSGYEDLLQWADAHPDRADFALNVFYLTSTSIRRRQGLKQIEPLAVACSLIDERVHYDVRLERAARLQSLASNGQTSS